ncbi:MAG: hypothetical protein DRJ35_01545, partial [Thermoprotei archaeon]
FKFGPIAEKPIVVENRGLFLGGESRVLLDIFGVTRDVIVGPDIVKYMGSLEDLSRYLVYPMRDGVVDKNDERAWRVLYELTKYGFIMTKPSGKDFEGFYVTAALSAIAPDYMYEKIFDIHARIDRELGVVKAVTIIPQPLAVAIAEKVITCVVVESGHGNTQITPISMYPIRNAIVALNRGGAEADAIAAEILRDLGYEDRAREEKFVRMFKEAVGLVPRDLDKAIEKAKSEPERFKAVFKIPGTRIEIDMAERSWMRFLIGEVVFNPEHEIFESYYKRGMPRPRDTIVGGDRIRGTMPIGEAIEFAVSKTSIELQPSLFKEIILSGGNFAWRVPPGLEDVAVDSAEKVKTQLREAGIESNVYLVSDPLYSVWKGTIVYSLAVPEDFEWDWSRREGWFKRGVHF